MSLPLILSIHIISSSEVEMIINFFQLHLISLLNYLNCPFHSTEIWQNDQMHGEFGIRGLSVHIPEIRSQSKPNNIFLPSNDFTIFLVLFN